MNQAESLVYQSYLASEDNPCRGCNNSLYPHFNNGYHYNLDGDSPAVKCIALTIEELLEQRTEELAQAASYTRQLCTALANRFPALPEW